MTKHTKECIAAEEAYEAAEAAAWDAARKVWKVAWEALEDHKKPSQTVKNVSC